jgi:hypothetical protein
LRRNDRASHDRRGRADYKLETSVIDIPNVPPALRGFLRPALDVLPDDWRVTVFPGRMILYKESQAYPYAIEAFTKRPSILRVPVDQIMTQ